jgi:DNA (cytosine-5)-methyltransferase 1
MKSDIIAPNSMRLVKHRNGTLKRFIELQLHEERGKDLSDVLEKTYGVKKHSFQILNPSDPAPTVTSIPDDFMHYCEPRVLTVRELARIQSFPDWFEFLGKYTTGGNRRRKETPRYTQVANAVPPFIAEIIGMALKRYYDDSIDGGN